MIPLHTVGLSVLCFLASSASALPERSVSTSGQFLVFGNDIRLRGAICELAEKTKREVLRLVNQRDEWAIPIVIDVHYSMANLPEAPRAALRFAQTGFGLKLQLNLAVTPDVEQLEARRELLRTILLEMMYRGGSDLPAGTAYVSPPEWLLEGVPPSQSALGWRRLIDPLAAPVAAQRIRSLEEFLRSQEISSLDAPSRLLNRAYSFALVEFLTQTARGRERLAHLIADLPSAPNNPVAHLLRHFPELGNSSSVERAWELHIKRLATAESFHLLSAKETSARLDKFLVVEVRNAGSTRSYHLEQFSLFVRNASGRQMLARSRWDLNVLATRANPIYRQLIHGYERITALLAQGKTAGVAKQLARLSATRNEIADQVRKIDSYMDWFEATQNQEPSGVFADYLRAAAGQFRREQRRRDPISVYLDVFETQFQN